MQAMHKVFTLSFLGLVAYALAQAPASIYSPSRTVKDQGITLTGWGSGTIAETDEAAYEGTTSIRVSTRNFFQGGIMSYANPVSLSSAFQDPNNLLILAVHVASSSTTMGGGGASPVGGDGREGGGRSSAGGGGGAQATATVAPGAIDQLRIIISTSDGKKSEAYLSLSTSSANDKGWIRVGTPLRAISGFERTNQQVSAIAVSANAPGSVYIGEVRILNDATPIYGELLVGDMNIGSGSAVNLSATGQAGASILKYTWKIKSASEPEFTFEGQNIAYRFRKPGTYSVSVTISDIYGLKKPYTTSSATITVN